MLFFKSVLCLYLITFLETMCGAGFIRDLISTNKVVIFSKSNCPYCVMAKQVFDTIEHQYTVVELDARADGKHIQSFLGMITGTTTVPQVFVHGKCVGGGTDVKKMHEKGLLTPLLQNKAP